MGRPRAFDETAVLDAAAGEFRVHGHAATSTEQLCEAAGVRRSSLYNTFESKDELFVRALERYVTTTGDLQEAALTTPDVDGLTRLRRFFDLLIDEEVEAVAQGHAAGCMVVGTRMTPDVAERDPRVARLLDRAQDHQRTLLEHAVSAGRRDGSIRDDAPVTESVDLVVALVSGIRVMAQSRHSPEQLRRMVGLGIRAMTP